MKIKPIILSGGSGTRLWPLSRENKPKQFFDIFNEKTNLDALIKLFNNNISKLSFDKKINLKILNSIFNQISKICLGF